MIHSSQHSQPAHRHYAKRHPLHRFGTRLAAGLLALGGLGASALASAAPETRSDGEAADAASVVALSTPSGGIQHYAQQPQLLVGKCVALEAQRHGATTLVPVIANHCDYPVTVSYCINASDSDNGTCATLAGRKFETRSIQPGASIKVEGESANALDGEIDWVACRGDSKVFSSLFKQGGATRGECLAPDAGPGAAVQTAVTLDNGPR